MTYFDSIDKAASFAVGEQCYRGVFIAMNAEKMVRLYREPNVFLSVQNPVYYPDGVSMFWFQSERSPRILVLSFGCEFLGGQKSKKERC